MMIEIGMEMVKGSVVLHKRLGWIGIVVEVNKYGHPMVNLSDAMGILFRWVHRDSLVVLKE